MGTEPEKKLPILSTVFQMVVQNLAALFNRQVSYVHDHTCALNQWKRSWLEVRPR